MSTTNILDLNNRIDELEKNSGGSADSDWTRLDTSSVYYRKIGKIVYVRAEITEAYSQGWSTLATLPVGYRPILNVMFSLYSSTATVINCRVTSGGEVQYVTSGTISGTYTLYTNFIADN